MTAEQSPSSSPSPFKTDFERIQSNHERELQGWALAMGTSPERLKKAVQAVGITPRKVRAYLRQMG